MLLFVIQNIYISNSIDNPIGVRRNGSADPWVWTVGTLVTPGDYTYNDIVSTVVEVQRTAGVSLASISATISKDTSADHVLGDNSGQWQLQITLSAPVIIYCIDGDVTEHRRSWPLELLDKILFCN